MNVSEGNLVSSTSSDNGTDLLEWTIILSQANRDYWKITIPSAIFMVLLMLSGIPGNFIVLFVYTRQKSKATVKYFMICLATLDLFACVIIHPYVIMKLFNNFNQHWTVVCKCFEFFIHATLTVSVFVLILVAVDRYNAICRPMKLTKYSRHVVKILGSAFVLGSLVSVPLFAFYGRRTIEVNFEGQTLHGCICDYSDDYQNSVGAAVFGCFMLSGFVITVISMTALYTRVAYTAYKQMSRVSPVVVEYTNRTQTRINTSPDSQPTHCQNNLQSNSSKDIEVKCRENNVAELFTVHTRSEEYHTSLNVHINGTHEQIQNKISSKFKAAKILFLVTAVFFLSWLPFWIIKIARIVDSSFWLSKDECNLAFEKFLNHLFYINNAANPIIYTIINKQFRQETMKCLKACRNRH